MLKPYFLMIIGVALLSSAWCQTPEFKFHYPNPNKLWPFIFALQVDREDNVWAGIADGALYKYDGVTWTEQGLKILTSSEVRDICFDSSNQPWVATNGGGLFKRNTSGTWTKFTPSDYGVATWSFRRIEIDKNNHIWAQTLSDGVLHFNGSIWKQYSMANSPLKSNSIGGTAIGADSTTVWIAEYDNVYSFKDGVWTLYDLSKLITGFSILHGSDLFSQSDGSIWYSTHLGNFVFRNNQWEDMRPLFGEISTNFIHIDQDNRTWIAEKFFGLHYYDGQMLLPFPGSDTIPSQPFVMVASKDKKYMTGNLGSTVIEINDADMPTGLFEIQPNQEFHFTFYPNPTSGEILIKDPFNQCGPCTMQFIDPSGRIHFTQDWTPRLSLTQFSTGIYTLLIFKENKLIGNMRIYHQP